MDEENLFAGLDQVLPQLTPPPAKPQKLKPDRNSQMIYYHGRAIPQKQPKQYSYAHIKRVLYEQYELLVDDITPYKGTRYASRRKTYRVRNMNDDVIVEKCNLWQLGKFLEEQGDY